MTRKKNRESDPPAPSDFDRFRDLAAGLAKVPKEELDEARERDRLAKG